MSLVTLAQERRSQPQQILDLQREYSELVQRFALDSQAIHKQLLDHDAALVHFRDALDANYDEWAQDSRDQWTLIREHEARLDCMSTRTFWQRLRWLVTGRL